MPDSYALSLIKTSQLQASAVDGSTIQNGDLATHPA